MWHPIVTIIGGPCFSLHARGRHGQRSGRKGGNARETTGGAAGGAANLLPPAGREVQWAQTGGCDAVVAYQLPKLTVVGSNPITRSKAEEAL